MNIVEAALRQIATDLNSRHQRWALVGGFAVSVRAEPRFTRDVAVAVPDDNAAEGLVHSSGAAAKPRNRDSRLPRTFRGSKTIRRAIRRTDQQPWRNHAWTRYRSDWCTATLVYSREKRVFGNVRVDVLGQRGKQPTVLTADIRPRLRHGLSRAGGHLRNGLRCHPGRVC